MLGVVTVTEDSIGTKDRTLKQDENTLQIYNAINRIEWDISHIYSPLYYEKVMTPQDLAITKTNVVGVENENTENLQANELFASLNERLSRNPNFKNLSVSALPVPQFELFEKGDLSFFTIANRRKFTDSKEAYYAWVRYRLEDQETESEEAKFQGLSKLVRYFVPQDPFSLKEIDFDAVKPFTLLRNVKSLKFSFWSRKAEKFVDSIKETDEPNIIRGIKVTIEWIDDFGAETSIEHIALPLFPFFDVARDIQNATQPLNTPNTGTSPNGESEDTGQNPPEGSPP